MKKIVLIISIITFSACSNSDDSGTNSLDEANIAFSFSHSWNETSVTNSNFNTIQYTNANGEEMSLEKLRYLISNITFQKTDGEIIKINGYNLVDVTNNKNMIFLPETKIPFGDYSKVSFTFGFNNTDNTDGVYVDLNTALWNVPTMLGGGYHYMQLEGKFIDNTDTEVGYQYHTIRAVNNSDPSNLQFEDTFFEVDLGSVTINNDVSFNIKMNIAEWFMNPIQWDLNMLNSMLMPNFNAQILMYNNGQNVFSLESITQQ